MQPRHLMRRGFVLVLLSAVSVFSLSCDPLDLGDQPEAIVLGTIYNLSGIQSSFAIPSWQGASLAAEHANRNGGVLGRPIQLAIEDGESRRDIIEVKTTALLERFPGMSALLGLSDSDMVMAAAPVAAAHKRLFLTSGATSPHLPEQVPEYLFLACFGDNVQAAAAAEWAYEQLGARTVSVLFDDSQTYTRLLHGYFQTRFEQLGGKVLSVESYTPDELDDLSQPISRLQMADLVFLSAEVASEALQGVLQLREAGITVPILGGDGFDSADVWPPHPELSEVYFTTHVYLGEDNPDSKVGAFRAAYTAAFPGSTPTAFSALGYDAVQLLIAAIEQANSADPGAVREALAGMQFDGVTGTISYTAGNRIPSKSVTILEIDGGALNLVDQWVPTQVPVP